MRILIVANKMPYPAKDGGAIATLSLATSLQKCGCEVDILAMNTPKHFCRIEDIPTELTSKIGFHSVDVDTIIRASKALKNLLFSSLPYNAERFITEDFARKLTEMLSTKEYDIVQLEGLYLCPYIAEIRKCSKAKVVLRAHNVEHEIWLRMAANESNSLKRVYKKILARRIRKFELSFINAYDLLVPITTRDGEYFAKNGNNKPSFVAPSGISHDSPLFGVEGSSACFPGFFHLGALDWIPNSEGLEWFITNVWHAFKKNHPDLHFYVAGRNAEKSFEDFLKSNGVDYLGEVESAAEFYAKGSVFIVPLLSGSGMRIKIVEGMAAGKTVITTSIGAEGIDVEDGKNILIADDAETFLAKMEKIAADKGIHERISINARSFVSEKYDNMNIASRLKEFYLRELEK